MSCAKFEPQWAYEWQIKDSDWARMILNWQMIQCHKHRKLPDRLHCTSHVVTEREPQYEEDGLTGQKMNNKV